MGFWTKLLRRNPFKQWESMERQAFQLSRQGQYEQAISIAIQVREQARHALGQEHPDYATILNNLALLYDRMGNYADAMLLYRQALDIKRKTLGEHHPDYAISLNNLAALHETMGDYASAEPLYRQASDIWRQAGVKTIRTLLPA